MKDVLFLSQLQAVASEDGIAPGEVTESAETILKTKDLEGRKTLFLRALAGLGSDAIILSAGQTKDLVTGSRMWKENTPNGASMMLMSPPGAENNDAEENDFIISTKLHLQTSDKTTEKEFLKYTDKSVKVPSSLEEGLEVMRLQRDYFEVFLSAVALSIKAYSDFLDRLQKQNQGRQDLPFQGYAQGGLHLEQILRPVLQVWRLLGKRRLWPFEFRKSRFENFERRTGHRCHFLIVPSANKGGGIQGQEKSGSRQNESSRKEGEEDCAKQRAKPGMVHQSGRRLQPIVLPTRSEDET